MYSTTTRKGGRQCINKNSLHLRGYALGAGYKRQAIKINKRCCVLWESTKYCGMNAISRAQFNYNKIPFFKADL